MLFLILFWYTVYHKYLWHDVYTSIFSSAQAKMEREYGILRDVDKTLANGMFQDAKLYSGMATSLKE